MTEQKLIEKVDQIAALVEIAEDQVDWTIARKALSELTNIQEQHPNFLDERDLKAVQILSDGINNRDLSAFPEVVKLLTMPDTNNN